MQEFPFQKQKSIPGFNIAVVICIAIVGFFLWTWHRTHLFSALPYLLLLACPLMHFFMHRSHGRRGAHDPSSDVDPRKVSTDKRFEP